MKWFISFIIAIVAYLILGLIAWNIVCSIIDISSKTLVELADYRIYTYSGVAIVLSFLCCINVDNPEWLFGILVINTGLAIGVSHWESIWASVALILAIVYNLVNVLIMTISIRVLFGE
jgi:hypothetical protein